MSEYQQEYHYDTQQSQLHMWEQSPFRLLNRAEVLENMRIPAEKGTVDLEDEYISIRQRLLDTRIVIIAAQGPPKSGKGGLLMGYRRLFKSDVFLQDQISQDGSHIEILTNPFAHNAEASKLPEVGLVPPNYNPATYTWEHVRKISGLQWRFIDKQILPLGSQNVNEITAALKGQKSFIVALVEASAPLCYPISTTVPVEVEGLNDLGNSTLYNLALDSRTRDITTLYMVDRDERVKNDTDSLQFREQVMATDIAQLAKSSTRIITPSEEELDDQEIGELSEENQQKLARLFQISMATPGAIVRLNQEIERLLTSLLTRDMIRESTLKSYYAFLQERLSFPKDRFRIISNPWFRGVKSYDSGYLADSIVLRSYPQLVR